MSTIGYSNFYPATHGGQAFTCIISMFGVVFLFLWVTVFCSAFIGSRIWLHSKFESFLGIGISPFRTLCIQMFYVLTYGCIYAAIYTSPSLTSPSPLTFGVSLYFSLVVSFTTIGCGPLGPVYPVIASDNWGWGQFFLWSIMTSVGIGLLFVLYTDSLFGDWRELIGVRLEIFRRHDVVDVVDAVDVVDVHVQMNTVFESGADPTDHPPQTDPTDHPPPTAVVNESSSSFDRAQ